MTHSEPGQSLRCPDGVRREFREMPPLPEVTRRARGAEQNGEVTA